MSNSSTKTPAIMTPSSVAASKLRKDIRNGRYKVGQKLDSEHVLANNFGVNRVTIRKALKVLQEERLITRRQGHGTFVTSPMHANTAETKVSLIGAMAWEKEYYFGAILNGAFSRSISRGYVLTTASNATDDIEICNVDAFIKSGIKGLIITPQAYSRRAYQKLLSANIQVAMLDATIPGLEEDFVCVNNRQGTEMATRHLIELGHTKIGYVGNKEINDFRNDDMCITERLAGFLSVCMQNNLKISDTWIKSFPPDKDIEYLPGLRELIGQKDRPSAIVAFSDVWALRVIQVAQELGLKIPDDLSVIGFDNMERAQSNGTPLTTIDPQPDELGTTIVDLLIEKIETLGSRPKRGILITPKLIIRESTTKVV